MNTIRKTLIVCIAAFGISLIASSAEAQLNGRFPGGNIPGRHFPGPGPVVISPGQLPGPGGHWGGGNPFHNPGGHWGGGNQFHNPGGWGAQGSMQSNISGNRYTQFNSATRGQIVIKTDPWGNKTWRPLNGPPGVYYSGL